MNMRIKITTNLTISLKSSIWSPANSWIRFTCSLVCPWMSFIEWSWLITLELKHNLSSQQTIFLIWIGLIRTVGSIPLTRLWTLEVEFLKKQERRTELSVKSDASIESQVELLHFKLPLLQCWDLHSVEVQNGPDGHLWDPIYESEVVGPLETLTTASQLNPLRHQWHIASHSHQCCSSFSQYLPMLASFQSISNRSRAVQRSLVSSELNFSQRREKFGVRLCFHQSVTKV